MKNQREELHDVREMLANQPPAQPAIVPGDVVQIQMTEKQFESGFAGLIMTVARVREWGVVGFVMAPNPQGGQPVALKHTCGHDDYVRIGHQAFDFVKPQP